MFPNRTHAGLALLLIALLVLTGGLAASERHDHGPFAVGHECAACQIAGAPADLPAPDLSAAHESMADSGEILESPESAAPEAPCLAVPHPRGPPLV